MDFLSGLRTVDFRVWISYLNVNFDYPNAVTRLTVDRAGAYGTPTCVVQINNSEGFLVGLPNIDLNKSRSFLSWLCSTHACWGALAPANLPMEELSGLYPQYLWSCNSGPDCYQDVAMWIACAYNHIFAVVVLCLLNPNLVSSALVIAHFCFSPPAYCPSIWCLTNHMFFEFTRMAPHLQFFSTALKLCKW